MKRSYFSFAVVLALTICCFATVKAQTAPPQTEDDKVYQRREVDKPAVILEKPRPQTGGRCKRRTSGLILMDVVLRKSGQVEILNATQSSSCDFFNKSAYEAAKAVTFEPAIKDGQPVSMAAKLEYRYTVY